MFEAEADILLMNHQAASPFHGALTDVNVWSRVLSVEEVEAWAGCRLSSSGGDGGRLVSWETASLTTRGVRLGSVERSSTCYRPEISFLISRSEKTFDDTVKFCSGLGGRMATARDEADLTEMLRIFSGECEGSSKLYTGHTDREQEGRWVEADTGLSSSNSWWVWRPGEPTGERDEDCTLAGSSGEIEDGLCSVLACPLCQINNNPFPRLYKLR